MGTMELSRGLGVKLMVILLELDWACCSSVSDTLLLSTSARSAEKLSAASAASLRYLRSMLILYLLVSGMLCGEEDGEAGGVPLVSVGEAAAEMCSPRLLSLSLPSRSPSLLVTDTACWPRE